MEEKRGNIQKYLESQEFKLAQKVVKKLLEKEKNTPMFFVYQDEDGLMEKFEEELVEEFGEYDPKILGAYFAFFKDEEIRNKIENYGEKSFFEKINDWDAVGHNEAVYLQSFILFFEPTVVRLRKLAKELDKTTDIEEKRKRSINLKNLITELLVKRRYTFYSSSDKEKELTFNDLYYNDYLSVSVSGNGSISGFMREIVEALKRVESEIEWHNDVGIFDKENFEKERLKFGAKGAFVAELYKLKQTRTFSDIEVPEFARINVSIYRKWKLGENISLNIKQIYDEFVNGKMKGKKVIVRSSAVYSEDNENVTGAGIYESIILEAGVGLLEFGKAIIKIYKSVQSEMAINYRKINNISHEQMGLVVQEFIESDEETKGYSNSIIKNVPELMEVVYEGGLRPVLNKEKMREGTVLKVDLNPFHYQFDISRKSSYQIKRIALTILRLEKYFGFPIQVEFIERKNDSERFGDFVLQCRFLPKDFNKKLEVSFPKNLEAIYVGRALGVVDMVLPVLRNKDDNSKKEGVVVFGQSKYSSNFQGMILKALPDKGVVVILGASRKDSGHIETICAEKGLTVIFSDEVSYSNSHDLMVVSGLIKSDYGVPTISDFKGHKKVRVLTNGIEGRVYETD
jgi:hypothetical protein